MTGTRVEGRPPGATRRAKAVIDPDRPVGFFHETERGPDTALWPTNTVLLANRECPFRCVYCDLWKHTLDVPTPQGAIPRQLDYALAWLPAARQIKLYNAGNFFDAKAIPPADHAAILERLRPFERTVIENHPRLCDERVVRFRDRLAGELEVAIGVETVDEAILPRLDKAMTLGDVERAVDAMRAAAIAVRAFILLPPPFETGDIVAGAERTVRWCFGRGCEAAVLIPLRTDSGEMPRLHATGDARPPTLSEVEDAAAACAAARPPGCRLFVDLWDAEAAFAGEENATRRIDRLREFNRSGGAGLPPLTAES